jgi:hypothetical protein
MATHSHLIDIHHKSGHAVHHHSDELINNLVQALECNKPEKKTKKSIFSIFGKDDESLDEDEDL